MAAKPFCLIALFLFIDLIKKKCIYHAKLMVDGVNAAPPWNPLVRLLVPSHRALSPPVRGETPLGYVLWRGHIT